MHTIHMTVRDSYTVDSSGSVRPFTCTHVACTVYGYSVRCGCPVSVASSTRGRSKALRTDPRALGQRAHGPRILGPRRTRARPTGAHPTLSDSARARSAHTRSAQLGPNVGQSKSTVLDSTLSESVVSASVAGSSTVSPLVDRCPCSGLRLHTSARSERTSANISKRGTRWDVQKACVHGKHTPAIPECQSAL